MTPRASSVAVERHFAATYGYRPSRAIPCPRIVAGKRCQIATQHIHGEECLCRAFGGTRLFDHPRIWLTATGDHVYTAEPYGPKPEDLAALREAVAPLGLTVIVGGYSPWNPGATTLIRVVRAEGR